MVNDTWLLIFAFLGFNQLFVAVDFITTQNDKFMYQGNEFKFGGGNWYKTSYNFYPKAHSKDRNSSLAHMDLAVRLNMRVLRAWAFMSIGTEDQRIDGPANAQKWMGDFGCWNQYYDMNNGPMIKEECMVALDHMIVEAGKRGLFLILPFINNWKDLGGTAQYLYWRFFNDSSHSNPYNYCDFYTDHRIQTWYQSYIKAVVMRNNTINGVLYRDDPSIMAWELMNEPRSAGSTCDQCPKIERCTDRKQALKNITLWVQKTADFIKSLDSNHMVTTGAEGFFNRPPNDLYVFQGTEGWDQDKNNAISSIDYICLHFYPNNWGLDTVVKQNWFLSNQTALSSKLQKPVVMEEFPVTKSEDIDNWLNKFLELGGNGFLAWSLDIPEGDAASVLASWALKYSNSSSFII